MKWYRALAVFLAFPLAAQAGIKEVDFSHYEKPLYVQIVDRIKAKVSNRLGPGPNTHDRYFIIPFAYENRGNDPVYSHSFISVIRVLADNQQSQLTAGLKKQRYQNRAFEAFTISWLPSDFATNPTLCVFEGPASRLFPKLNHCPLVPGRNFNLEQTIAVAARFKVAVAMWGPYEISHVGFDLGVRRKQLLDQGAIKYRADDRLYRKDQIALNCFHAMAGLDQPFPDGGLLGTGFKVWGFNGTARVLSEYTTRARYKGLLLEPVSVKNDRYGFVYAPSREGKIPYVPFRKSSAYR
ncbi:MAG: hypothetical protein M3Q46_10765 [Verrucomicrobiota bacterium]|nr:hypothetical protein [Verrucomicrobiota bacterium]